MSRIKTLAARLGLGLGWLVLVLLAALTAVEESGLCERWLLELLNERLGEAGAEVEIEDADFRWFEPGVVLHGFTARGRGRLIRLERVHMIVGLDPSRGLALRSVEIDGGGVLVGRDLTRVTRGLLDLSERRTPGVAMAGSGALPQVQARGVGIAVEGPAGEELEVGRLDLSLTRAAGGQSALEGRLALPRSPYATVASAIFLTGHGSEESGLEFRATGREIDLRAVAIPEAGFLDPIRALEPRGSVMVEGRGRVSVRGDFPPSGRLSVSLREGAVLPPTGERPIEQVELDLLAIFSPDDDDPLWAPEAWDARARFGGVWDTNPFGGGARAGVAAREGLVFESWAELSDIPFDEGTLELLGRPEWLEQPWRASAPNASANVTLGLRCHDDWSPPENPLGHLEYVALVRSAGEATGTWHGWPTRDGEPPIAFPLPITCRDVSVLFAHTPRVPRPDCVGISLVGNHAASKLSLAYQAWSPPVDMPPFAPGFGRPEEDLSLRLRGVAIDDEIREAMGGLAVLEGLADIEERYAPDGGRIDVRVHLARRSGLERMAAEVVLELTDLDATWSQLPAPLHGIDGVIRYVDDGRGDSAVAVALEGSLDSAPRAALRARLRREGDRVAPEQSGTTLEMVRLEIDEIDLAGSDRLIVDAHLEGVGRTIAAFAPEGAANLLLCRSRRSLAGDALTTVELHPASNVRLRPAAFPLLAQDVRGRVLVEVVEPGSSDPQIEAEPLVATVVSPLIGRWREDIPVAFTAAFPADLDGRAVIAGAALRPTDDALLADVRAALGSLTDAPELLGASADVELLGALDFRAEVHIPRTQTPPSTAYRFHLRANELRGSEGFLLTDLAGHFDLQDTRLVGDGLSARLGSTPVELGHAELELGHGTYRLQADFASGEVPLDREHLAFFLDEETLAALVDDLDWRGRAEVPSGRLVFTQSPGGPPRLEVSGDLLLSDVSLDLGLPITVGSASARVERLIIEDDQARGWGTIQDLYGHALGREVGPARMLLSLYGSRLSLDELDGTFVGGRLSRIDAASASAAPRPGPAFSVDLQAPYPFQLGVALEEADVGELLEGLFPSTVADRGNLTCDLELSGSLDDLLSIQGSGSGRLRESRLWSVPVFRDLFTQLGFERTAVFDEMSTRLEVADGIVHMEDIVVHSPILKLIGRGTLNMDGTLHHDLAIRYSLVDKIKPLTQLIYFFQNTLLAVSIRGDMVRPVVVLQGAFTSAFKSVDDPFRRLPVPPLSSLPARF
ncbi:MAG: AsmA-like C-terminal region-containing protein [Planctomycetota bacterium]|jgi:hypothetical protein|nr:AsmA-like C-terminal region-containing protein [Planctomycetota bacterium]